MINFCLIFLINFFLPQLDDMDLTMLRQMSRRAYLDAVLTDTDDPELAQLAHILKTTYEVVEPIPGPLQPSDVANILQKAPTLTAMEYNTLLQYLQSIGRPYRAFDNFPHPSDALILPPQAKKPHQFHHNKYTFSCQHSHIGNSAIQFYNPLSQMHDTGFIQAIYKIPLEAVMQTFIAVCPHRPLPFIEESKAPFYNHPGYMSRIVDAQPPEDIIIIQPDHIITHLTTYYRPRGTYLIDQETLIVCWALNRGRR